jgi:hypothetical protein
MRAGQFPASEEVMKSGNWKIMPTLSALALATMFAPYAHAGCGLYSPVPHAASWRPRIASPRLVLAALTIDDDAATPHGQQILQADQLYTNALKTTQNIIGAYNLAQRMATAPSSLYSGYTNMGQQFWVPFTQPANTYGNLQQFINAIATGNGAASANQAASIQRTGQISGYSSLSTQGQQAVAAQGATIDLSDAVHASSLQTLGTVRANSAQRETDISNLETASHSADPAQQTEMATLQRINQAMLIQLRTQQEQGQMTQAQTLQQMVQQKQQQDALKLTMQAADGYEVNYNSHVSNDPTGITKALSY